MATGAEHYRLAESCLGVLGMEGPNGEDSLILLAEAQVHATLALAAAIGVSMPREVCGDVWMPQPDSEAWLKAASAIHAHAGGGA